MRLVLYESKQEGFLLPSRSSCITASVAARVVSKVLGIARKTKPPRFPNSADGTTITRVLCLFT